MKFHLAPRSREIVATLTSAGTMQAGTPAPGLARKPAGVSSQPGGPLRKLSALHAVSINPTHSDKQGIMALTRIPTYAEIAAFRETIIKTRRSLSSTEFEAMQDKLVFMEYRCLRAINHLRNRTDSELMHRARDRAQFAP